MTGPLRVTDNMPVALGLVGFGVWQIYGAYTTTAPKLHDFRDADGYSTADRQRLRDTDFLVGGMTFIAAGTAAVLTQSMAPVWIALLAFAFMSGYHHLVLAQPTPRQLDMQAEGETQ